MKKENKLAKKRLSITKKINKLIEDNKSIIEDYSLEIVWK